MELGAPQILDIVEDSMCKHGDFEEITINPQNNVSKGNPEIARSHSPGAHSHRINVDRCLAPLIEMLNIYGIKTLACCCGHGKTAKSGIRISAQNIEILPLEEELTLHITFPYPGKKLETTL